MSAAEQRRPDRWPDAMDRWLSDAGPQPGTAMEPSSLLRAHGAIPIDCASHCGSLPALPIPVSRNRSTDE